MFVSSSLERIPQAAPIGKSLSFTQVNEIGGKGDHPPTTASSSSPPFADEETNPTSHSPLTTAAKTNAAATSIPIPTTRSTCHVKPLTEILIENDVEGDTAEESTDMKNGVTAKIDQNNKDRSADQNSIIDGMDEANEDEIRAQVKTKVASSSPSSSPTATTPSSTYSRYDIYRWRERPFGPSYRRKERQRREQELMEQNNNAFNNNNNNNNNNKQDVEESEERNIEEEEDRFHPFINRFTSPQTFYEEEYSYEPEQQISSMKTVLRTRSMINLDGDDGRVLVRKTLSDANLDQDKNTNYRFNTERSLKNNNINNRTTAGHHYFGYLDLQNHFEEKQEIFQIKKQEQNDYNRQYNKAEEGTFRQRLRELLVNNELVIQPRRNQPLDTPTNRRCFYHPVRINRELIDEELPDPDQVKLARDRFEKVLKIKGPEAPKGLHRTASIPAGQRITPEVRVPLTHSNTLPAKTTQLNEKWTDTGSLSSGISSASEDVEDQLHEVSSEVLQKIRACGTTVTYYGGKVIAQSHGPPSPLTSTIMEEIKFRLEVRDRLPFQEY